MGSGIDSLVASRNVLRSSIAESRALGLELDRTGRRLEDMVRRVPSLEPVPRRICASIAIEERVKCGVLPADGVLQVIEAVRELESSLSSKTPGADLPAYLSLVRSLEQALKFLQSNCKLAIQWLQGVAEFMEDNGVASDRLVSNVKRSLIVLQELEGTEDRARLHGGVMDAAFRKIEAEFRRLIEENSTPLVSNPPDKEESSDTFPDPVMQHLQAIIDRLSSNNRLDRCLAIYTGIRSKNVIRSLQPLDLDYLHEPFEDAQATESQISKWSKDLKFSVKGIFEHERRLCSRIFEPQGSEISSSCFGEIASKSGISSFLQFGKRVTEIKKSPNKLLNLLDIFLVLDELRLDFTRLFGGKACEEIQALTRDLIKRVVEGSWDIFWELSYQVELQRQSPPPSDGTMPKLVSFVTEYCNRLLGDTYRPTLIQVMAIHQSWKGDKYQEGLFTNQIYNVVKEIGLNLDTWSKAYQDRALSCLFMMNNHCHFSNLGGTKLGDMMGDSWLRGHEQYKDYYAALYVKESWEKVSVHLREGSSSGLSFYEERRRLQSFNRSLEETYENQYGWSVTDERLREKVRASVKEAVLPGYQDYLHNYRTTFDEYAGGRTEIKYSVQDVERMIEALFEPKPRKVGTSTRYYPIDKLPNVMTSNQFHLTLTAA